MSTYLFLIIFICLWYYLCAAGTLGTIRSVTPNFQKAVFSFSVPVDLDEWDFYDRKFLYCYMKDRPGHIPLRYQYRGTTKGLLIREFVPGYTILDRRAAFVPWSNISDSKSVKVPWYLNKDKYSMFEIKGTPMFLMVRNKYLEKSGFNRIGLNESDDNIE